MNKLSKINWGNLSLELIVVFLGVTGGFLLNNWRTEQQEQQLEQKYIGGFLDDVNKNITELEDALKKDSLWHDLALPKIKDLKNKSMMRDSATTIMKMVMEISNIKIQKNTYEDITNSGNLNIISDFDLKSSIVNYNGIVKGVEFVDAFFYEYFNNFVMPFVFEEYNVLNDEFLNPNIFKTVRFTNMFAGYFSMVQQRQDAYRKLLEKSNELQLKLIKYKDNN